MLAGDEQSNYPTFRECLSSILIRKLAAKPAKPQKRRAAKRRKNAVEPAAQAPQEDRDERDENDAEELAEFVDYLASEIFAALPADLRTLSHSSRQADAALGARYGDPLPASTVEALAASLPASATDSLETYALAGSAGGGSSGSGNGGATDLSSSVLSPLLSAYVSAAAAAPPVWAGTRAAACELCERDWIPLTYHHLVPKAVHDKARKRGWHDGWRLNSVAWLCRACHSFVHGAAGNEELAREWYTVELLRSRKDVQRWAKWVGRVRWKSR